jgi:hypothetical protein
MPGGKALTTGWREVHRLLAAGYDRRGQDDEAGAGAAWLKAWSLLLKTMDESGVARLAEIGPLLPEGISINKWVPDVHMTLWNAGLEAAHFHEEGVRFTTEFLRRFEGDDMGLTRNVRCALASLHAHLGRFETADALFGAWLSADPRWGWGWLRWAFVGGRAARHAGGRDPEPGRCRAGRGAPEALARAPRGAAG